MINLHLKIIQSNFIFRHCAITKSGWDRHLAYSFKLAKQNNNNNGRTKNSYNNSRHQVFTLTIAIYISYYLTDRTKIYSLRPLYNVNLTSISANYPDLWNITVPVQSWLGAHDPHWPECEGPGKPDSHLFPKSLWWGHSPQTASDSLHLSDGPKFTPHVQQLWGQQSATVSLCKVFLHGLESHQKIWVTWTGYEYCFA